jgi:hypothetical protein
MPQVPNASTSLPHEVMLALDKVIKQRCASLFLAQLTIEGAPTILHLKHCPTLQPLARASKFVKEMNKRVQTKNM